MKLYAIMICASIFSVLPFGCRHQEKFSGKIESYTYTSMPGMNPQPNLYIKVYRSDSDGTPLVAFLRKGYIVNVYKAPEDVFTTIDTYVREYKFHRLKNHYQPKMEIMDGGSWNMYINYEEGSVSSGGYVVAPPKRYNEGIDLINTYLSDWVDGRCPEDIVESVPYREFIGL